MAACRAVWTGIGNMQSPCAMLASLHLRCFAGACLVSSSLLLARSSLRCWGRGRLPDVAAAAAGWGASGSRQGAACSAQAQHHSQGRVVASGRV